MLLLRFVTITYVVNKLIDHSQPDTHETTLNLELDGSWEDSGWFTFHCRLSVVLMQDTYNIKRCDGVLGASSDVKHLKSMVPGTGLINGPRKRGYD
jgi:hypothetical protein